MARLEHELHTAHTILDVQGKSCRAAGIEPRTRNALLIAVQPLAAQVGVAPACQALGVSRASFYRRQRSTPGHQQPRIQRPPGRCVKPSASRSSMCSPARASSTVRRRRSWRRCSTKAITCARSGRCIGSWPPISRSESGAISASIPSTPSPSWWPRRRIGPDLVLGHHQAVGADQVDVLLPLRRARHLQPLRGRLDGRNRPGELGAGRSSHRRDLPQTGRPAPGAHPALRPRRADDEQVHRTTARRPRRDPFTEPPSGVRRQPLLRGPVQDPEVPPRLPWPLPRHHRRDRLLPNVLPLVQHRTSPWGGIAMLTRTTSITIEPRACWSSAGGPFKPPGPVIPNASFEESHNRIPFPKPSGSTHLSHPQQEKLLTKSQSSLSQSR